jgi:hypothetical protein
MKTIAKLICASILAMMAASSCVKEAEQQITFSSDPAALNDVPCMDPDEQVLNLTTNANWIVVTPTWVKADPIFGSGNAIVSFTVESTYINDKTDVAPRSGEIVFSGGGKSYVVPITQLGYTVPYDPSASIGGIPDVDEFMKFVQAVNENEGMTRWQNESKEIELLADIDLSEFQEWTPIGAVESVTNGNYAGGYNGGVAFKGVFDGGGHTIRGFKPTVKVPANGTFGLFGVLDGATVRNLNIETDLNISADGQADAGVLAGTAISSTIQNVKVNGKITSAGTGDSKRFALGGIAGFVFNTGSGTSTIKDCTTNLIVNADCGKNTANGAAGAMYGGIAGFVTTSQDDSANNIENCVNNGEINAKLGRSSGIVATANFGGHFLNCTNNANQVSTISNGRIGNVVSVLYKNAVADGLVNNGNLTVTESNTHAGAIVGFFNDDGIVLRGGRNTGTIIAAISNYKGLIGANLSKFTSISGVTVGGQLGTYKADGNHEMIDVNAGNFTDYIGVVSDANRAKITDLTWDGAPAPAVEGIGTAADLKEFAELVKTGGDVSKFLVDGVLVLGADIDLGGEDWTPIGSGSVTNAGVITAGDVPFTGVFDGRGHIVDNFKVSVPADAPAGYAAGLFGILNGATVKNVVIGPKAVFEGQSAAMSFIGGVAGFALNSTMEGCTNKATMSLTAAKDATRECLAGIVGEMYTAEGDYASYVKNCVNEGSITSKNSVNANNGGNGLSVAGIVGFSDGKNFNYIQNCTNKVAIAAEATRLAGIVASANAKTKVEDCVNEGKISGLDVKASNSRIGGICSAGSTDDVFTRCINRGDIVFDKAGDTTHGYAAGILGQSNNPITIDACENYGAILSDMIKASTIYMGAILGNANSKAVTIKNCKVGGKVGPLTVDADHVVVTLTPDNFAQYITLATSKAGNCTFEGNVCGN